MKYQSPEVNTSGNKIFYTIDPIKVSREPVSIGR